MIYLSPGEHPPVIMRGTCTKYRRGIKLGDVRASTMHMVAKRCSSCGWFTSAWKSMYSLRRDDVPEVIST
jgi:hypothetical protein